MLPMGRRKTDVETIPSMKVSVQDEGIGIPSEEVESVFDKFVPSSKIKTGAGGRGLGLAISKECVEAQGGTIWAENCPERGASFSFFLPLRPAIMEDFIEETNHGRQSSTLATR